MYQLNGGSWSDTTDQGFWYFINTTVSLFCFKVPCWKGKESIALKELLKVLKDYNNRTFYAKACECLSLYQQCFILELENVLQDPDAINADKCGMQNVFWVCLEASLLKAITKMQTRDLQLIDLVETLALLKLFQKDRVKKQCLGLEKRWLSWSMTSPSVWETRLCLSQG